jgi:hypothetical protein
MAMTFRRLMVPRRVRVPRALPIEWVAPAPIPVVMECRLEHDFDDPGQAEDIAVCFESMGSWIEEDWERHPWDPIQRTYYAMNESEVVRERYIRMWRRVRSAQRKAQVDAA